MLHRFRLLLIPVLATVFLVACGSETNNNASITDSTVQEVTTSSEENDAAASDIEETIESEESQPEETAVEETEVVEEIEETEQAKVEEPEVATNQSAEKTAAEVAKPEETDDVNPDLQNAVEQLLEETDIDLENHTFFFTETDEYIEIEVRENIDGDATPLVGIYRYIIETDELLANDYLTGEFIPFESIQ